MQPMAPQSVRPTVEALLAHAEWVRALARSLVRDPDTAEEVAQQTLVAAWLRPPGEPVALEGWLVRCIRNFAHGATRTRERRSSSEALAAKREAIPSAHDVVERASLSRELVEHVFALEEPYRTAILLRYFDEKTPAEIARELGLPAATVRTHVARGLERLRERLDHRHGGRDAWAVVILPFLTPKPSSLAWPALLAMNTTLKIVPVALGIVAVAYFALRPKDSAPNAVTTAAVPVHAPAALASQSDAAGSGPARAVTERDEPRVVIEAAPQAPSEVEQPVPTVGARGRVLDFQGHAMGAVKLATSLPALPPEATPAETSGLPASATDGSFAIPGPLAPCRIRAADAELATVLAGVHGDRADEGEIVVVVAPALAGEGSVVDQAGNLLEGVDVRIELPGDFRSRFSLPLDRSVEQPCQDRTDERGNFALTCVPRIADARLVAERGGYEPWSARLGDIQSMPITITLLRPGAKVRVLAGRVVDGSRLPLEGAYVAFGARTMRSEADGSFRFPLDDPNDPSARFGIVASDLQAAFEGYLPARYEPPIEDGRPQWPEFVELALGASTFSIAGKVLDHEGRGRAGLRVWIADSTTFGIVGDGPAQLESLLAGAEPTFWPFVETGVEGEFRLDGLLDRTYTLAAMDPSTLLRTDVADIPAGSGNVVLEMPRDALFPRVAGVVRGHDGRGVEGASVAPMCDAFRAQWQGAILGTSHSAVQGVRTDSDGRFELTDVPKSLVYLRIDGEGILPLEYGRFVEGDERFEHAEVRALPSEGIDSLEIRVDRRAHLQVELADPASADQFALVDERGVELELSAFSGHGRREGLRHPIYAGRSDVVAGSDRARSIVLFKAGEEIARFAVALVPGETKSVRF